MLIITLMVGRWLFIFRFNDCRSICIGSWKHTDSVGDGNQSRKILSTAGSYHLCENSREFFLLDTWIEPVYSIHISFKINFVYVVAKRWKSEKHYVLFPVLMINDQRKIQLSKIIILPWVTVTPDDKESFIKLEF